MLPTQERLDAEDLVPRQADDRLVVELELVFVERQLQLGAEL